MKVLVPIAIFAVGVALALLLFATRETTEQRPPDVTRPSVHAHTVAFEPVELSVEAFGTVVPRTESDLVPEVSGPVVWISPVLAAGGFFEQGEALVRIDRADYEAARESQRAEVARAEAEHTRAIKELERQGRLSTQSIASDARFDDAVQREKVGAATVRDARAQLARAERDLDRTELHAPYAGRVRSAEVGIGQFVTRGNSIARLYAVDYAEVRLPIPDSELRHLDLPMLFRGDHQRDEAPEVILRAEFAGEQHEWRGFVVRTEGEIDPRSRMVHVLARVEDPYGRNAATTEDSAAESRRPPLAVGLFVQASIRGRRVDRVAVLPRAALRSDGRVVVVDAAEKLHHRDVELLRKRRDEVVISAGLEEGEQVLISALPAVVDGMWVRIAPAASTQAHIGESAP